MRIAAERASRFLRNSSRKVYLCRKIPNHGRYRTSKAMGGKPLDVGDAARRFALGAGGAQRPAVGHARM